MRTGERAQIGAACSDDRVDVVGLEDGPDSHGGNADLVADLVGEGGLVEAPIDRFVIVPHLTGRAIYEVGPGLFEQPGKLGGVRWGIAALGPVVAREPHRDRAILRPHLAHGAEYLERVT